MEIESQLSDLPDGGGIRLHTRKRWVADTVELLSSMRFAISLLCMIAIASIIGTVMKQNEPMGNYINQFGPFWYEIFRKMGLYAVYSSWWFLLIMAFLVVSTSLCLIRNTPKMLKDMRSWRDNVREESLRNFHHRHHWQSSEQRPQLVAQMSALITRNGYRLKVVEKNQATLITAKKGAANKWGYIFAHAAIVIICVGGLLDSDLSIRFQQWFFGKVPFSGNGLIADIPAQHRLSRRTPTFRGNMQIPEGASGSSAIIAAQNGVLIQDLPISIELKRFVIDYYSTGMPKLFASDVVVKDLETGTSFPATIRVNHPLIYKGLAIFQSSFDDGGSHLKVKAYPMQGASATNFELAGDVGSMSSLPAGAPGAADYSIEWSGFRAINVENTARDGQDVRAVNTQKSFDEQFALDLNKHLGSAAKNANSKDLKNIGPSLQYRLRDKTGQAREFHNYMQPVELDGAWVFLAGTRDSPNDAFRYLRIPADDNDSVAEWMRLRAAMANPVLRDMAAQQYAKRAFPDTTPNAITLQTQLQESARRSLAIFAGETQKPEKLTGFAAISQFIERIPAADQAKAAEVFMKIFNGSLWDLWQLARQHDGLAPLELDEKHARFLQQASSAMSDAYFYGAPVFLQLTGFDEIKASVLQITRSPGQNIVYLGCVLLVLGIFSMFYIRERRLWVWLRDDGQGTQALLALSSQRKTLDFEKEFEQLRQQLPQSTIAPAPNMAPHETRQPIL